MLAQAVWTAILALSISGANPTGTALEGRISDGSTPVSGAIVTISDRGLVQSTSTDENGRFLFKGVPSGRYAFRISAQGYALYECPVVVRDGDLRRNRMNITALIPADQQTISVDELRRRQSSTSAPKGYGRQTGDMRDGLR